MTVLRNGIVEFIMLQSMYKTVMIGDQEEDELVKIVKSKIALPRMEVASVSQVLNENGNPYRSRVKIERHNQESIIVMGRYEDVKNEIYGRDKLTTIGY